MIFYFFFLFGVVVTGRLLRSIVERVGERERKRKSYLKDISHRFPSDLSKPRSYWEEPSRSYRLTDLGVLLPRPIPRDCWLGLDCTVTPVYFHSSLHPLYCHSSLRPVYSPSYISFSLSIFISTDMARVNMLKSKPSRMKNATVVVKEYQTY